MKLPVTQAGVQPAAGGLAERGVKYIIHAVGPTWTDWSISEKTFTIVLPLIQETVHRALDAAVRMKVRSIAIPAVSGGIFTHYRVDQPQVKEREQRAARKAVLEAVLQWTSQHTPGNLKNPADAVETESSLPDSSSASSSSSSASPSVSTLTTILICDLPRRQKGGMHFFLEEFAALVPLSKDPIASGARPAIASSSTAAAPVASRPNRAGRTAAAQRPEWQGVVEKKSDEANEGFRF